MPSIKVCDRNRKSVIQVSLSQAMFHPHTIEVVPPPRVVHSGMCGMYAIKLPETPLSFYSHQMENDV